MPRTFRTFCHPGYIYISINIQKSIYPSTSSEGGVAGSDLVSGSVDAGVGAFIADAPSTLDGGKALKLFFPCTEVEDAYQV